MFKISRKAELKEDALTRYLHCILSGKPDFNTRLYDTFSNKYLNGSPFSSPLGAIVKVIIRRGVVPLYSIPLDIPTRVTDSYTSS
jgi:hypothetical protein